MRREAWSIESRREGDWQLNLPWWSVYPLLVLFVSALAGARVTFVPGGLPYGAFSWLGGVASTLLVQLAVVVYLVRRR